MTVVTKACCPRCRTPMGGWQPLAAWVALDPARAGAGWNGNTQFRECTGCGAVEQRAES